MLHYTGMSSGEAALARLRDPAAEVSCHYLVWEDGRIDQLVAEADRAWHAGRSSWCGEHDINSVSIGVEIVNAGHDGGCPPYPDAQLDAVAALCRDACGRHGIAPSRVLAHSDIAPTRKLDPGEHFPWRRLAIRGVALALPPAAREPGGPHDDGGGSSNWRGSGDGGGAATLLARIGYDIADLDAALRAFQRRWRPERVDGALDRETLDLLLRLAAASAS